MQYAPHIPPLAWPLAAAGLAIMQVAALGLAVLARCFLFWRGYTLHLRLHYEMIGRATISCCVMGPSRIELERGRAVNMLEPCLILAIRTTCRPTHTPGTSRVSPLRRRII